MSAGNGNNGHPDPSGPEEPDEPARAHDGEPTGNGGKNLTDAITDDSGGDIGPPEPPPLPGDKQLSLGGLGKRGQPIEAQVSMMSAGVRVSGLFDPDKERLLVVTCLPAEYRQRPVREDGQTKRWKYVQQVRPLSVRTVADMSGPLLGEMAEAFADEAGIVQAVEHLRDEIARVQEHAGGLVAV